MVTLFHAQNDTAHFKTGPKRHGKRAGKTFIHIKMTEERVDNDVPVVTDCST